jgi:hypothetical protein
MATQQQVTIKRQDLPAPDLTDPGRIIVQIEYQVGTLPPRFLYIDKKAWTEAAELAAIKADMSKRMNPPTKIVTI